MCDDSSLTKERKRDEETTLKVESWGEVPPLLVEVRSPADVLRESRGREEQEGKEKRRADCHRSHPRKHLTCK